MGARQRDVRLLDEDKIILTAGRKGLLAADFNVSFICGLRETNPVETGAPARGCCLSSIAVLLAAQAWHRARKLQSCAEIYSRSI